MPDKLAALLFSFSPLACVILSGKDRSLTSCQLSCWVLSVVKKKNNNPYFPKPTNLNLEVILSNTYLKQNIPVVKFSRVSVFSFKTESLGFTLSNQSTEVTALMKYLLLLRIPRGKSICVWSLQRRAPVNFHLVIQWLLIDT